MSPSLQSWDREKVRHRKRPNAKGLWRGSVASGDKHRRPLDPMSFQAALSLTQRRRERGKGFESKAVGWEGQVMFLLEVTGLKGPPCLFVGPTFSFGVNPKCALERDRQRKMGFISES